MADTDTGHSGWIGGEKPQPVDHIPPMPINMAPDYPTVEERLIETLSEYLSYDLPERAHVIAELSTHSVFLTDWSGKRWRLRLEEA